MFINIVMVVNPVFGVTVSFRTIGASIFSRFNWEIELIQGTKGS